MLKNQASQTLTLLILYTTLIEQFAYLARRVGKFTLFYDIAIMVIAA